MAMNPVRWFEIYVKDMNRAKRFYESVFSIRLTLMGDPNATAPAPIEMWGFPSDAEGFGCSGSLVKMEGASPHGFGTIVYFGSDDCAVEEKRAQQSGGTVERPKMSIGPYGFISLVVDTEGNMIGIHSMA